MAHALCVALTACHVTTTLQNVLLAVVLPTLASDRPIQVARRVWGALLVTELRVLVHRLVTMVS